MGGVARRLRGAVRQGIMWIRRRLSARGLVGARPSVAPVRILALGLCLGILSGSGCASRTPEWAESIDPCCGQDEVLAGMEPSESRCADFVVSREAALALAWSAAAGGGMKHWRVRILPGGPACVWKKWPGLTEEDYLIGAERSEEARPDTLTPDVGDSTGSPIRPADE